MELIDPMLADKAVTGDEAKQMFDAVNQTRLEILNLWADGAPAKELEALGCASPEPPQDGREFPAHPFFNLRRHHRFDFSHQRLSFYFSNPWKSSSEMLQCEETEAAMGAFKEMWARGEDPDDWMVKGSAFERFEAEAGQEYFKEARVDESMVGSGETEDKIIKLESFLRWLSDKHPEDDEVFNFLQENLLDDGCNVVSFSDMEDVLPPGYWDRVRQLIVEFSEVAVAPEEASIRHKAILFRINKLYRSNMSAQELYETTRGVWRVSIERAMDAELAMAVYQGIVREVYRINNWYPAGTLEYKYRNDPYDPAYQDRWEFDGEIAEDLRDQYVGKSVEVGRYPACYVNV